MGRRRGRGRRRGARRRGHRGRARGVSRARRPALGPILPGILCARGRHTHPPLKVIIEEFCVRRVCTRSPHTPGGLSPAFRLPPPRPLRMHLHLPSQNFRTKKKTERGAADRGQTRCGPHGRRPAAQGQGGGQPGQQNPSTLILERFGILCIRSPGKTCMGLGVCQEKREETEEEGMEERGWFISRRGCWTRGTAGFDTRVSIVFCVGRGRG